MLCSQNTYSRDLVADMAIANIFLEWVDVMLIGANAVIENVGVGNKLGMASLAMCVSVLRKPFYVVAEFYKFA